MSEAVVAVSLIFIWVLVTLVIGVLAGIKRKFSLEGYLVSGRALGLVFMYVLMAGEVYSAYAFLGTGGWAYSYGAPIMYIGYAALAYSFGYFYAKYVWKAGKKLGYMTQGDLFRDRYGSVPLAVYMALVGIVFMIPYIQLQLQGLGYILHVTSFGKISVRLGIIVGMTV
ncbi:MAG: sodium:solute symporter family protein, partial [Thermoplasmata archaeon]|nr:sodium:solute symporter family protein [Thermoplasmata archaeon]